jgi:cell division protein FtsI/penicillin-binding protein 2
VNRDKAAQQPPQSKWQARWAAIKAAPRVVVVGLIILCVFAVFVQRLWYLQFTRGEYYRGRADRQRLRAVSLPAARGIVYDRDGTPLVRNVPGFDVMLVPAYLPDDEVAAEAVLIRLAMLLDMPYITAGGQSGEDDPRPGLREMFEAVPYSARYRPLVVKRGVDRDTALLVAQEAMTLPGVSVEVEPLRSYPYGPLVSQLVGYLLPVPEGSEAMIRPRIASVSLASRRRTRRSCGGRRAGGSSRRTCLAGRSASLRIRPSPCRATTCT